MGRVLKWIIGTACTLVGLVVFLLVGGFCLLNTSWLQGRLLNKAVSLLTEKLDTKVAVDSVSIDLLTLDAKLYGVAIDDRQQRRMLQLDHLKADIDLWPLLEGECRISEVRVEGVKAELHKLPQGSESPDTVANYQFFIDAFKADTTKAKWPVESAETEGKQKLVMVLNKMTAAGISVRYNEDSVAVDRVQYTQSHHGQRLLDLRDVRYKTNNHQPRKNAGRPKRGFFDVGHFDIQANMQVAVDSLKDGTLHGWFRECTVRDSVMGIDIRKLQCEVTANKEGMHLCDVQVQQGETELNIAQADMQFPNKKTGAALTYSTTAITGRAVLRDIARCFAPVLGKFTLPLDLSLRMEGNDDGMRFHDVVVTRPGGLLKVRASGGISGLKDKYKLKVHFDVHETMVKGGEKERIISQFPVKKLMMKQLHRLGTIRYEGSFNVLWKKEEFQGLLHTKAGAIKFYLALDENNKYVFGHATTKNLQLGEVMDMKDIGPVSADANFRFDISKPRTALMRHRLGGKLPIGQVKSHVTEASYKFAKVRNIDVDMSSNGAVAEGSLLAPGRFADLSCTFSFTNTSDMRKMKVRPRMKLNIFRGKNDGEKQRKADEKAARKAAKKAARKAVRTT